MRSIQITQLLRLPTNDIGRGRANVAIDAVDDPFVWIAERVDTGQGSRGTYRFLRATHNDFRYLPIAQSTGIAPRLYPFTDGRLLLIFHRHSGDRFNATVYSPAGEELARFATSDAVGDVQITADGRIWVSYHDESGDGQLDCFTSDGERIFRFASLRPPAKAYAEHDSALRAFTDCYALNVSSENTAWAYYVPGFRLVRIVDLKLAGVWDASAVSGSHAFAVDGRRALFAGTYDRDDGLFLFDLTTGEVDEVEALYDNGWPAKVRRRDCIGRGTRLYVNGGMYLSVIALESLVSTT